jgi:hypothetical protein
MWFLLRAVVVIAVIAYLSPQRGAAEREAARFGAEAPVKALAQVQERVQERAREAVLAEAGRTLAGAAEGGLRGALAPAQPPR